MLWADPAVPDKVIDAESVDSGSQAVLEHFLVWLYPRYRAQATLERCIDWDNHRCVGVSRHPCCCTTLTHDPHVQQGGCGGV